MSFFVVLVNFIRGGGGGRVDSNFCQSPKKKLMAPVLRFGDFLTVVGN